MSHNGYVNHRRENKIRLLSGRVFQRVVDGVSWVEKGKGMVTLNWVYVDGKKHYVVRQSPEVHGKNGMRITWREVATREEAKTR